MRLCNLFSFNVHWYFAFMLAWSETIFSYYWNKCSKHESIPNFAFFVIYQCYHRHCRLLCHLQYLPLSYFCTMLFASQLDGQLICAATRIHVSSNFVFIFNFGLDADSSSNILQFEQKIFRPITFSFCTKIRALGLSNHTNCPRHCFSWVWIRFIRVVILLAPCGSCAPACWGRLAVPQGVARGGLRRQCCPADSE